MRVQLLYFAGLKDLMGTASESLLLPDDVRTVAALQAHLSATKPQLAERLATCRVAVNEEFAAPDTSLEPDVDVALIPPVSGG